MSISRPTYFSKLVSESSLGALGVESPRGGAIYISSFIYYQNISFLYLYMYMHLYVHIYIYIQLFLICISCILSKITQIIYMLTFPKIIKIIKKKNIEKQQIKMTLAQLYYISNRHIKNMHNSDKTSQAVWPSTHKKIHNSKTVINIIIQNIYKYHLFVVVELWTTCYLLYSVQTKGHYYVFRIEEETIVQGN